YVMKKSSIYGVIAGLFNGASNFAVLLAYNYVPISVAEPLKAGLAFIVSFFISLILFKERFTKSQVAGVVIGIASVVMFNI
ncbi:MAG: hypothetical protein IIV81_04165, partial [Clostridia bacterium]|nr:hypothetical protein [Clostridia bacterium]